MGPLLSVCAAAWATHRSAPPNAGNLKAHASPADEIKQMLWVLWHLMKQLEVFQKTGGLLASSPPTCFWCRGRLRDVQIFIKESVTQRSNPLWRAAESGHLNLRQRQQRGFCMVQCKLKYNDVSPKKKKRQMGTDNETYFVCWRGLRYAVNDFRIPADLSANGYFHSVPFCKMKTNEKGKHFRLDTFVFLLSQSQY